MPNYITFSNPGLIDLRAIKTFGASSKEGDNPFGYFGTGLKYAIGILLRNKQNITIFVGEDEYRFSAKPARIRNDDFDIVMMNDEELGFTTQIGKNWKPWMAYRELYCNAMDENGVVEPSTFIPLPEAEVTKVIVEGREFLSVHLERSQFILDRTPLEIVNEVEICEGSNTGVFYKGIKICRPPNDATSVLTYNLTAPFELTEDRTAENPYAAEVRIRRAMVGTTNPDVIETILSAPEESMEGQINLSHAYGISEEFLTAALSRVKSRSQRVNDNIKELVIKHKKSEFMPEPIPLSIIEQKQLEKAIDFCAKIDYPIDRDTVFLVETLGENILGQMADKKIYLAKETFAMGTKMVAITLIEEYIHLTHGLADMTRGLQNMLFNKIISLAEELQGEPL